MGNVSSGYFKDVFEEANATVLVQNSVATRPRTPIPTHKHRHLFDPRSPTEYIVRTPIEVVCESWQSAPVSSIENELDPRSPTEGIFRTPILIPNGMDLKNGACDESLPAPTPYLETNLDELISEEESCEIQVLTKDIQNLSTEPSVPVELPAVNNTVTDDIQMGLPSPSSVASNLQIPTSTDEMESSVVSVSNKNKKLTETPPGRKGIRKRNKENGILKQQLSKSDKLPVAKVRTPLGTVTTHNQSPLQIVRGKQCRTISQVQPFTSNIGENGGMTFGN